MSYVHTQTYHKLLDAHKNHDVYGFLNAAIRLYTEYSIEMPDEYHILLDKEVPEEEKQTFMQKELINLHNYIKEN